MCVADGFPAIKWFSATDDSGTFPTPVTCYPVDKRVDGFAFSDWASWFKLLKLLDKFPP